MSIELLKQVSFEITSQLPWLNGISTEDEYTEAVSLLNEMIVSPDSYSIFIKQLTCVISEYEQKRTQMQLYDAETGGMLSGVAALNALMTIHNLKNINLVDELGSTSLISQILNGKRSLTIPHIKALSARFNVPPSIFL